MTVARQETGGRRTTASAGVELSPEWPSEREVGQAGLCAPARRLREASIARRGPQRPLEIVGLAPVLETLLLRLEKIAGFHEPVLILGESGVGKELFSQALHLVGPRADRPFVSVNCPQYQEGNLTVSELFGHRKGSFTGATSDRRGCFETANGGVVFLDEIGDLHLSAQVMLLRALATGEFQPVGSDVTRTVDVRVVAATNRSLNQLAADQQFRRDLLFRLRYFLLEIPPLRSRGDDWRLLLEHTLNRLGAQHGVRKRFSEASVRLLGSYEWPGNVRELMGVVTTGYALCDGDLIEPRDFVDHLEQSARADGNHLDSLLRNLISGRAEFWRDVQQPFLARDFNRSEVRWLVGSGLREAHGGYRHLLRLWGLPADQYDRFMGFLRHHGLKSRGNGDSA